MLRFISAMASRGYLRGALPATQHFYAEISSQFVPASASGGNPGGVANKASRRQLTGSSAAANASAAAAALNLHVAKAVNGLASGGLSTMVPGEQPQSVLTDNIKATMRNALVSSSSSEPLKPPLSDAEKQYGAPQPSIRISATSMARCNFGGGYAQTATGQFGTNPHEGSGAVSSPLMHFEARSETQVPRSVRKAALAALQTSAAPTKSPTKPPTQMPVASAAGVPAYYVTMPFTASAKFNLSTILKYGGVRGKANYSIPVCSLYNGNAYVSCGKCNVTSLTAHNVTYGCFDISVLCPWSGSGQRRLMAIDGSVDEADEYDVPPYLLNGAGTLDAGGPMEDDGEATMWWSRSLRGGGGGPREKTDDLIAKNFNRTDDGGGDDVHEDDEFSHSYQVSINQFSALAEGIAEELNSVLSLDWSKVDIAKALPVIIFVSCLTGIIVIGFLFFKRWDKLDRHVAVYLREYRVRLKRLKVKEDLLKVMHHSPPSV